MILINNLLIQLIVMSLFGSFVYLEILIIGFIMKKYSKRNIYFLLKMNLLIYLIPAHFIYTLFIFPFLSSSQIKNLKVDFNSFYFGNKFSLILLSRPNYVILTLFFIWILGVLYFTWSKVNKIKKLRKRLSSTSIELKDETILSISREIRNELNIKKGIPIFLNSAITSPFIIGTFNPIIYIPQNNYYFNNEIKYVLKHEFVHYKNKDILFKNIINFISIIYWFNPVIYFCTKSFYYYSELACDETVVKSKKLAIRKEYCKLIIESVKHSMNLDKDANIATFLKDKDYKKLQRRLEYIMEPKKKIKLGVAGLLTTIVFASCPLITYGAVYSTQKIDEIIQEKNSVEEVTEVQPEIEVFEAVQEESYTIIPFTIKNTRGANELTLTLATNQMGYTSDLSLSNGNSVTFVFSSNSSTDQYKVGLQKGSTKRYVSSTDGAVTHTFKITEDGTYKCYIQNTGSTTINITGYILVN